MKSEVFCEDCLVAMKRYPDKFFDIAICDPPYGINAANMTMGSNPSRKGVDVRGEIQYGAVSVAQRLRKNRFQRLNGGGKLKNRILNTSKIDWDNEKPSPEYFSELFRVSKNQIIFGGNYFNLPPTRGIGCWDKVQPWDNFSQWEMIWTSFDCPAFMIRHSNKGGANLETKIHPTQKPVEVYRNLLNRFAKPGDKILDTHLGSGSSRIAAYDMGFDFTGFELDKSYFDDQEKRFKNFISQTKLQFS